MSRFQGKNKTGENISKSNHTVTQELKCYLPKLKSGGYSMGDDYNWTPVAKSVHEAFGEKYKVTGKDVWYAVKD